jgi:hypothetical protein
VLLLGFELWDSGQRFQKKFEAPIHHPLVAISGPSRSMRFKILSYLLFFVVFRNSGIDVFRMLAREAWR